MKKKTFFVPKGVHAVNGQRVPRSRKVRLTESQAMHDLSLGRLSRTDPKAAKAEAGAREAES